MARDVFWRDDRTPTDVLARQLAIIALERRTNCLHVDAFVRDGCVTLTGRVDSPENRIDAELVVRTIPGITGVLNYIQVAA